MKTSIGAGFLFLWLRMGCVSRGENVEQSPSILSIHQGAKAVINCTYSDSSSSYFPWYKQERGKSLQLIIYIYSTKQQEEGQRLTVLLDKNAKHLSLHIADTQPGDSAVYFCAAAYTGYSLHFGKGTSLLVTADIPDPKPAVYQLTNSKSNNMSVCLFTDFDSRMNTSEVKKPTAIGTTTTVLDMRSTGSKSNGILAWTSSGDSSCNETFSLNNSYFFSSDSSCNAKLVEENFRTDWDMNFQNLSVMALRILFLKLTGFNLLMTLRLWSS